MLSALKSKQTEFEVASWEEEEASSDIPPAALLKLIS